MKRIFVFTVIIIITALPLFSQTDRTVPSFEEVLSLKSAGSPIISPEGDHVLFTVTQTDWENNRYDTEIQIHQR